MELAATFDSVPVHRVRNANTFASLLVVATILPIALLVPTYTLFSQPISFALPALAFFTFLQPGHVAITALFYLDPRARPLIARDKAVYIAVPVMLIAVSMAIAWNLDANGIRYFVLVGGFLTFWHHGRQNLGVYSFLNRAWRLGRPSQAERHVIGLAFMGTIYGAVTWYAPPQDPALVSALFYFSVLWFVLVCGATLVVGLREFRVHKSPFRLALFSMMGLFFLPSILFSNIGAAASFAAAHAAQYWVFLFYVLYRSPETIFPNATQAPSPMRLYILGAIAVVWPFAVLYLISQSYISVLVGSLASANYANTLDRIIFGLIAGWGFTHFLVDAYIWRMSDPAVRQYHQRNFDFIDTAPKAT